MGTKVKELHHLSEHHIMENTRPFSTESPETLKETPILIFKFPVTDFLPIKSHRADRYTHTAMTPFTVGPLYPTVFKSESLWLNEHIPDRTPLQ